MADLVRGRHHLTNPIWNWLGQLVNLTQSDVPARSNLDYGTGLALTDETAALASGVATAVPVPVEYGDVYTRVSVIVGGTAASTPTHSWAAFYNAKAAQATPAIVGTQSTDGATAAIAASATFNFTMPAYMVNPTDSPQGILWVAVCVTGTATPSLACYTLATAVAYPWFTNSPVKMGAITSGSSLGASAPSTLASPAAQAKTPIVVLT